MKREKTGMDRKRQRDREMDWKRDREMDRI